MATCEEIEELRDLYVIGGLPADVAEDVETHLETCASCRAKVAESWGAAQLLRLAVPQVDPPAELGERVVAAAAAEGIGPAALTPAGATQARSPQETGGPGGTVVRLSERQRVGLFGSGTEGWRTLPLLPQWERIGEGTRLARARWPWLASAAALLPLALSGWLAFQVVTLRQQMDSTERVLRRSSETAYSALDMMGEGIERGARMAKVEGTEMAPSAHGMLYYGWKNEEGVLVVSGLPPLRPDQVYQLWLVTGNSRTSGGLLYLKEDGRGMLVVKSPMPLTSVDAVGITNERRGGSEQPEGQRYMWGRLKSS